jgi:two-component system sensor histidine kinase DegS
VRRRAAPAAIDTPPTIATETVVLGDAQQLALQLLEAQEEERARVAEELHDGPAQALANISFQVEIVDRTLRADPAAVGRELDELRRLLHRESDRLRGFIHQLRPPLVEETGLENALREMAELLTEETGIPVDLSLEAPPASLDLVHRSAVLRVTQEALRNVRKHARASRVWLTTRLEEGTVDQPAGGWVLEIRDDGEGFEVNEELAPTARHHFGLRFMRERARHVGARLEIRSAPGLGTTVRLVIDIGERS